MQFRVLGPLQTRSSDGRLVRIGAVKPRLMLATLLLSANRPVSVDRLSEAIWGSRPPRSAASALRTYASALRDALSLRASESVSRLIAEPAAYRIELGTEDLDLLLFEELAAAGQKALAEGNAATAAAHLQRGLALWRGRTLEDLPLEAGFSADVTRLEELRLTTIETWVEVRLALGEHAELVTELRRHATAHPLRERLYGLWMRALYQNGQQAQALAAYRELRENLVRELGIEPGRPLQRLQRQILSGDPALDAPAPADPPVPVPRQLPRDVVGFIGRAPHLSRLQRLTRIGDRRPSPVLVAIDGVAGVGKSALAIRAAHRIADRFPDGHLYTDLQGSSHGPTPATPLSVLNSFLRALGGRDDVASLDEAAARFRDLTSGRRMLVLLDNARDARQVEPLLPAGPGCAVLITSRRALASLVHAARVHLDMLGTREAVAVLGKLAGRGRVAAEREAAVEVARLCGCLPLALRIAGARLAARPGWRVRTLADRLVHAQHRLDELQVGDIGVRTSFQVSLDTLWDSPDPQDRAAADAFPLLVVADGADLSVAAAARLLDRPESTTASALERLVDAHLLDSPEPGRYRLHDLLRLFALEHAAERYAEAQRRAALVRVLRWYQVVTRETLRLLRPGHLHPVLASGPAAHEVLADLRPVNTKQSALAWLNAERANLVSVIRQAVAVPDIPPDIPFAIAQALFGYFQLRGYWQDWIAVNEAVLPAAQRAGDLQAIGYAHRDLGVAHELRGDYEQSLTHLRAGLDALRRAGDRHGEAACLTSLAVIDDRQGRHDQALASTRQSLAIRRELGDVRGQAVCLSNLGVIHVRLGQYADAQSCYQDSLAIFRRLDDPSAAATVLTGLGEVYEEQGQYAEAVTSYDRSLRIVRGLDSPAVEASTLNALGRANRRLGRHDLALAHQQESLALTEPLGDRYYQAASLRELGATWRDLGRRDRAEQYWRRAAALFSELGVPEAAEVQQQLLDQAG
jgi:DNA-binding SARP family transcriptional activator/Tfp pilus assembly protein PilF